MKKKQFLSISVFMMLISTFLFASCMISDDEKKPEIVDDPLAKTEEYYISGKILDNSGNALEGVIVNSSNGISAKTDMTGGFKLKLSAKSTYKLTFDKQGYLGVTASVTFAANAPNRSSMNLSLLMSKISQAVRVTGTEDRSIIIPDDVKTTTYVEVVPGAVSKATDFSVTVYTEPIAVLPVVPGSSQQITPALETAYFEPSGTTFAKPIIFSVNNPVEADIYFENLSLAYKKMGASTWETQNTMVNFIPGTNRYETELKHFSSYSIMLKANRVISAENTSETNVDLKKDNTGNIEAIRDFKIEFNETAGWNFSESLDTSIKNALTGISGSNLNGISKMIQDCVASLEGGKPGFYKISHSLTTNISGNYIVYYINKAKFCDIQYKFNVNYKKSNKTITVKVKRYTGMKETYTNKDSSQHSGGSGS